MAHFGVAFLMKSLFPEISLSFLFAATNIPDIFCLMLILTGDMEFIKLSKKYLGRTMPFIFDFEYSHSLFSCFLLGILLMIIFVEQITQNPSFHFDFVNSPSLFKINFIYRFL